MLLEKITGALTLTSRNHAAVFHCTLQTLAKKYNHPVSNCWCPKAQVVIWLHLVATHELVFVNWLTTYSSLGKSAQCRNFQNMSLTPLTSRSSITVLVIYELESAPITFYRDQELLDRLTPSQMGDTLRSVQVSSWTLSTAFKINCEFLVGHAGWKCGNFETVERT